jgi:DNA-binding NtrC family response regulator
MQQRILIVDDEEFFSQGFARSLQNATTDVRTADTAQAALTELAAFPYDLCFLDFYLPDSDGEGVLKKIGEISPQTKVIVMTAGIITNKEQEENIERNAYLFITKPFDLLHIKMLTSRIIEENFQRQILSS